MTYDELFSTPSAQKAQGDDDNDNDDDSDPLGATGEYEVISVIGELLERETRRRSLLFLCITFCSLKYELVLKRGAKREHTVAQ